MPYPKDHFRLVPLSEETLHVDTEELVKALNDELDRRPDALGNLAFFEGKVTYGREKEYLSRMIKNEGDAVFLVRAGESDRLIGTAGLHEIDRRMLNARIGVVIIDIGTRGRGFGSRAIDALLAYAFTELYLNKVYLNVFAENERGRKLYSKLGFVEEGMLLQEYLLRGRFHDMIRMRMLRSEWETQEIPRTFHGGTHDAQ